jgi:hypothetical protein
MPSIFPDVESAGALVVRDAAGVALHPDGVQNAYSPPATYVANCLITGLPSDCEARIEPRQINAIVSELVALAECLDPNGPWDCSSLKNLCAAFEAWLATIDITGKVWVSDQPPPNPLPQQFWFESDTGYLFVYYQDANTSQWVQVKGQHVFIDGTTLVGRGIQSDPIRVGVIDCGSY